MLKSNYIKFNDVNTIFPRKNKEECDFWYMLKQMGVQIKISPADNSIYSISFNKSAKFILEDIKDELEFIEKILNNENKITQSEYLPFLESMGVIEVEKFFTFGMDEAQFWIKSVDAKMMRKIYDRLQIPSLMGKEETVYNKITINGDVNNDGNLNIGNDNSINIKSEYAKLLEEIKPLLIEQGINEQEIVDTIKKDDINNTKIFIKNKLVPIAKGAMLYVPQVIELLKLIN